MPMMSAVVLDTSPANVLRSMRGEITAARIAHPDVLHVELRGADGSLWRLATQDADWSPADPVALIGRTVVAADIDESSCELRCRLADDSVFRVKPTTGSAKENDPPYWELISPSGIVLEFGPGVRWRISATG